MSGLSDTDAAPEPQQLGCPKCRYAQRGCKQCRRPGYKRRPGPSQVPAAKPADNSRKRKAASKTQVTEELARSRTAKKGRAGAGRSAKTSQTGSNSKERLPASKPRAVPAGTNEHTEQLEEKPRRRGKRAAASAKTEKTAGGHPAAEAKQQEGAPVVSAALDGEALSPATKAASMLSDEERRANFSSALRANMAARQGARAASTSPATSVQTSTASGRSTASVEKPKKRRKRVKVVLRRQIVEGNPRVALWEPPPSPFGLIEELLYQDPWRLLLACMLLNKTSGIQVRKVLWNLFALVPTAEAAAEAEVKAIEAIIYPLGLFRKRAVMVKRFSQEYVEQDWHDPLDLHGIGQYAADAYFIFCRGDWRHRLPPADKDLLKYYNWLHETDGQGMGLEREQPPVPVPAAVEAANLNLPEVLDVSQQTGEVVELRP